MNRAIHGDVVAVEVFPESEWKSPGDEVIDQEGTFSILFHVLRTYFISTATLKNDDVEDSGDEADENDTLVQARESRAVRTVHAPAERQPTGRIVGIIKRNWRAYVIFYDPSIFVLTTTVVPLCLIYIGMSVISTLLLSPPRQHLPWLLKMSLRLLSPVFFHVFAYARAKLLY